jgi:hypothetical protein
MGMGRLENKDTPKAQHKIDLMTSSVSTQHSLSIDMLTDREAMLEDVRARVFLMKRDLSKLMLGLHPSGKAESGERKSGEQKETALEK